MKETIKKVKGLNRKWARAGIGSNPKFHFLNTERRRLSAQKLAKVDFRAQMADITASYDADHGLQQLARDAWMDHRLRMVADSSVPPRPRVVSSGVGPWGLGDSFWPVSEDVVRSCLHQHTKCGSIRDLACKHKEWQAEHLVVGDNPDLQGLLPSDATRTCNEKHLGLCRTRDASVYDDALKIAKQLHHIRSSSNVWKMEIYDNVWGWFPFLIEFVFGFVFCLRRHPQKRDTPGLLPFNG